MEASAVQLTSADTVTFLHRATGGSGGSERLNTVPLPEVPPYLAVPCRVLLDIIRPPTGLAPSLPPVKSYRFVNPVPSVLTAKTVPRPELPPAYAAEYRMLPDKTKPPIGLAPSRLMGIKACAVAWLAGIKLGR